MKSKKEHKKPEQKRNHANRGGTKPFSWKIEKKGEEGT